jgi:hypothetical protein
LNTFLKTRSRGCWFWIVLVVGLVVLPRDAASIAFMWDADQEPDVVGYKLYYGSASRAYTNHIDVGNVTTSSVAGLANGNTYYFAATAYDSVGLESTYSSEVSYTLPLATNPLPTIVLTSPLNGASYAAPAVFNLAASVTANGHKVTQVQFYSGATLLGAATTAPYGLNWSNVLPGNFVLTASVIFDSGGIITSAPANVVVRGLPPSWQTGDIGSVGLVGNSSYDSSLGVMTVTGSGVGIGTTSDEFQFVWQLASGDCSITAKVTTLQDTGGLAKAGVMIRETLNVNSMFADLVMTPASGAYFQYRNRTAGSSRGVQSSGQTVPYWVRVTRSGSTFNGYISSDGVSWVQVGIGRTISMASSVYIGLCLTSGSNAALDTSTFSNVSAIP